MKKTILLLLVICLICGASYAQAPTLSAFSPTSGPAGTTVTITGTGFNATAANDIVFFGATRATVSAATTTSLTVTVPAEATYQYLSVTNLSSNKTGYASRPFDVTLSGSLNFAAHQDFSVGSIPYFTAIADFDGDGNADEVVANTGGGTMSILRNTSAAGTVSFAGQITSTAGSAPPYVMTGDFDGDGKIDIAIENGGSNNVYIYRNTSSTGSISFASPVTCSVGSSPQGLGIGDIDGDGLPDIVASNVSGNNVSVLRNTSALGSISFATQVTFSTGTQPVALALGDMDGDGKIDIAATNVGANTVSALRNTSTPGSISFAAQVTAAVGSSPNAIVIGDIDGDGKLDLAIANFSAGISLLRNTSVSGTISFATQVTASVGTNPSMIAIGDIDGDGKPDLATANFGSNNVSVLKNISASGSVSFAAQVTLSLGTAPRGVTIGDVDGDGYPDIITTDYSTSQISVFKQVALPTITSFSPSSGPVGTTVTITGTGFNITIGNNSVYFGATKATVTAATTTSLTVTVPASAIYGPIYVTNTGTDLTAYSAKSFDVTCSGSLNFNAYVNYSTGGTTPFLEIPVDVDGDGKPDVVVSEAGANYISVFRNQSTPGTLSFGAESQFNTNQTGGAAYISAGDFDGDGKIDIVASVTGTSIVVYRNTSTSGSISFASAQNFSASGVQSTAIADIDGDGKPDIVMSNDGGGSIKVLRNTSTGAGNISFAAAVAYTSSGISNGIAVGDIDGDGKADVIGCDQNNSRIFILRNTSTPGSVSFATYSTYSCSSKPIQVALGDLDGDGKLDVAVANQIVSGGGVSVFRNTSSSGSVSLATYSFLSGGNNEFGIAVNDIDGDGKPDIASVANIANGIISVFKNNSTSGTLSFAAQSTYSVGNSTYPVGIAVDDMDGDGLPDLVTMTTAVTVIKQAATPQGSLTANGPLCVSGTGQLTWTATSGTGPYTVVYNDGTANRTATSVASGTPFNTYTNPVTSTTTYTLVSVTGANSIVRSSGFTGDTAIITVGTMPTAGITGAASGCNSVALTATGGSTYTWSGGSSMHTATDTFTSSATYTVTVTLNGCTASTSQSVDIYSISNLATLASSSINGVTLTEQCTVSGWTYYANPASANQWLFGIYKNGNTFTANVDINIKTAAPTAYYSASNSSAKMAGYTMGRYWNVTLASGSINGSTNPVSVRFFYDPADTAQIKTDALNQAGSWGQTSANVHAVEWFKTTTGVAYDPANNLYNGIPNRLNSGTYTTTTGSANGVSYAEYDGLQGFSGGTAGVAVSPMEGALPVELIYVGATPVDKSYIKIEWATASELENAGFEVERSTDAKNFEGTGWVAGQGNSTVRTDYSLNDDGVSPNIIYYYRLKQTDVDGHYEYSTVVCATVLGPKGFVLDELRPNPAINQVTVNVITNEAQTAAVTITDVLGREVAAQEWQLSPGLNGTSFDISRLAAGTYTVTVKTESIRLSKKLIRIAGNNQ